MLRKHLHDTTVLCECVVIIIDFSHPLLIGCLVNCLKTILCGFVWAKNSEISRFLVQLDHITKPRTQDSSIRSRYRTALGVLDTVLSEIGQNKWFDDRIGQWICTYPKVLGRNELLELRK
jgi:hypothetical protein